MKKFSILLISVIAVFLCTIFYTYRITSKLNNYELKKEEVVELLDAEERLGNVWEWVPFLNPAEDLMNQKNELEEKADIYYDSAVFDGFVLGLIIITFLLLNYFFYKKHEDWHQMVGLAFVVGALSFLYLGLQSPFLELEAYMDDVTVKAEIMEDIGLSDSVGGRVYFFYQNHSVIELIELLFTGGNFFVAILIVFFSVVFPLVKLISSVIILMSPSSKYNKGAVNVVNKIGKWSMADVFVAAIFLAFFSFSNSNFGIETGSTTLIGLYFFVAFVGLSLFSGYHLKRVIKKVDLVEER